MTSTSSDQPHVSICCEPGLFLRDSSCYADDSIPDEPIILPEIYHANLSFSAMSPEEFVPQYGGIQCLVNTVYQLHSDLVGNPSIYLLEDGTIYVNHSINEDKLFSMENYCFASQMTENATASVIRVCEQLHHINELRDLRIASIVSSLSIPFFVAIFIIYTILPELRNINGHIFRCYIASLIVSYTLYLESCMDLLCTYAIIVTLQFSTLASFFWMNVMSFDIWWTFGGFGSLQRNTSQQDRKKFIIYSCYAWGCSALITGIGMIMDVLPIEWTNLIRPGLRENCWFESMIAGEIYLAGPMAVTIIVNLLFFGSTAIKIRRQKKNTSRHLEHEDSRRHDENVKQRFNPYLKLCILMGIPRMAEIVVWRFQHIPDYYWYTIDLTDSLQGPLIFIIFVWKENTKQLLLKRLRLKDKSFCCLPGNNACKSPSDTGATATTAMLTHQENTSNESGHVEPTINGNNA